jgi:hypothetical protein
VPIGNCPPASTAALQGYQVLCSPGPSSPPAAAFDTCAGALPTGGAAPFASLDAALICSGLVGVGTNAVRVHGLNNGTPTTVAVIAIGDDGTASAPSVTAEATPGPTIGDRHAGRQSVSWQLREYACLRPSNPAVQR